MARERVLEVDQSDICRGRSVTEPQQVVHVAVPEHEDRQGIEMGGQYGSPCFAPRFAALLVGFDADGRQVPVQEQVGFSQQGPEVVRVQPLRRRPR